MPDVTGLFLVDKPAGPSSFGCCAGCARRSGASSATPARSTRSRAACCSCSPAGRRGSRATCRGSTRPTARWCSSAPSRARSTPRARSRQAGRQTDAEAVTAAAAALTGGCCRRCPPPPRSRRRRARLRADAARRGGRRRRRAKCTITELSSVAFDRGAQRGTFDVACSKGTYVRQIAADLGEATGAGAYCLELRRTHVGPFIVDDAARRPRISDRPDGRWFRDRRRRAAPSAAPRADEQEGATMRSRPGAAAPRRGRRHPPARPRRRAAGGGEPRGETSCGRRSCCAHDRPPDAERRAGGQPGVALGSFDGVHLGHRQ